MERIQISSEQIKEFLLGIVNKVLDDIFPDRYCYNCQETTRHILITSKNYFPERYRCLKCLNILET